MTSVTSLRVLVVLDVPCPPFTSLTPGARRAYGAACAQWTEIERVRLRRAVGAFRPVLRVLRLAACTVMVAAARRGPAGGARRRAAVPSRAVVMAEQGA